MSALARSNLGMFGTALGLAFVTVGCTSSPEGTTAAEPNDLGIATVTVERTTVADGRLLDVRGLSAAGEEIAAVHMKTGQVLFNPPEKSFQIVVDGVDLALTSGGDQFKDVAPDHYAHAITEAALGKALRSFVHLRTVAQEIAVESGITFAPVPAEQPYSAAGPCNSDWFLSGGPTVADCCSNTTFSNNLYQNAVISSAITSRFINATSPGGSATACKASDGSSSCSGNNCYYGPCGASAPSTIVNANGHVFVYVGTCAWDDGGPTYGVDYYPVRYNSSTDQGGVSRTCGSSSCP